MGAMKWIAGLLGFAFGGGIFGGVIGYAVGSLLEKMIKKEYDGNEQKETSSWDCSFLLLP